MENLLEMDDFLVPLFFCDFFGNIHTNWFIKFSSAQSSVSFLLAAPGTSQLPGFACCQRGPGHLVDGGVPPAPRQGAMRSFSVDDSGIPASTSQLRFGW